MRQTEGLFYALNEQSLYLIYRLGVIIFDEASDLSLFTKKLVHMLRWYKISRDWSGEEGSNFINILTLKSVENKRHLEP